MTNKNNITVFVALAILYLIGSFIGGSWNPFNWHWVLRVFMSIFTILTVAKIIK